MASLVVLISRCVVCVGYVRFGVCCVTTLRIHFGLPQAVIITQGCVSYSDKCLDIHHTVSSVDPNLHVLHL